MTPAGQSGGLDAAAAAVPAREARAGAAGVGAEGPGPRPPAATAAASLGADSPGWRWQQRRQQRGPEQRRGGRRGGWTATLPGTVPTVGALLSILLLKEQAVKALALAADPRSVPRGAGLSIKNGAGEADGTVAQWLKARAAFAEDPGWISAPTWCSQPSVTLAPDGPTCSGLWVHATQT